MRSCWFLPVLSISWLMAGDPPLKKLSRADVFFSTSATAESALRFNPGPAGRSDTGLRLVSGHGGKQMTKLDGHVRGDQVLLLDQESEVHAGDQAFFTLDQAADSLIFETDADHGFVLVTPDGEDLVSSIQGGIHRIFLNDGAASLKTSRGQVMYGRIEDGQYVVRTREGHDWVPIRVRADETPETHVIKAGETNTFSLEPGELTILSLLVPEDAQDLTASFRVPEGAEFTYTFSHLDQTAASFSPHHGFKGNSFRNHFRATTEGFPHPRIPGPLTPGQPLFLWLHSDHGQTMDVGVSYRIGKDPLPQAILLNEDGNHLRLPLTGNARLVGNDIYLARAVIEAPMGTRSISLDVMDLEGSVDLGVLIRRQNGTWLDVTLDEVVLGGLELGCEPDAEPVDLYFYYNAADHSLFGSSIPPQATRVSLSVKPVFSSTLNH